MALAAGEQLSGGRVVDADQRLVVAIESPGGGAPSFTANSALAAQTTSLFVMQNAAVANGNGTAAVVDGYSGAQQIEVAETAGGTCTLAIQGTFDGTNWITGVGYQQVDNVSSIARAVANISVAANTRHVYQVLDPYKQLRAVISAVAGGATVTVKVYAVPA